MTGSIKHARLGEFQVRTLSQLEQRQVAVRRSKLTDGQYGDLATSKVADDRYTALYAHSLAVLLLAVDDGPDLDLSDQDPEAIIELWGEYDRFASGSGKAAGGASETKPPKKPARPRSGSNTGD